MGGYPPEGDSDKKQIQRGVQAVYRLRSLFHSTEKYCLEIKKQGLHTLAVFAHQQYSNHRTS